MDLEVAVRKHSEMLYRICIVILGSEQDTQDAIQETFCKYLEKKPKFVDGEHEKAWLIKVATNHCRDIQRFRFRHPKVPIEELAGTLVSRQEDREAVRELLQMPPKQRAVMVLHYVEGYQVKEIAGILGITEHAVKKEAAAWKGAVSDYLEGGILQMSEMNGGQLRHALKQVHMKENMQEEIIMNVRTQMADGTYRRNSFKRMAMSAAAFMLVFGAVSIPSYAAISNLVRARMEAIPRAEVEATEDMIQSQQIHADQFSREYTREERKRMDALRQEYENGMFPENSLTLVENESQVPDGDTLAYTKDTGCFYLPDRELTDEELLQILDFNVARDYALDQSPEVQKAREEAKAEAEERAAQAGEE